MKRILLYIAGAPGIGKSTLTAALTEPFTRTQVTGDVPYVLLSNPATGTSEAVELGVRREHHPGTDALAMNISGKARAFLAALAMPLVIGEGSRLATIPFLSAMHEVGYAVHLVHLHADTDTLDARCKQRGTTQNPQWRKGAATRARNLAAWARANNPDVTLYDLDAVQTTERMATILRERLPQLLPGGTA